MGIGTHHRHLRTRIYRTLEQYPHPSVWVRLLDRVVFIAGFVGPVMTLPQLHTIFVLHEISGISALTWGAYAILDIPWIVYGFVHKERVIIFAYTLWFVVNGLVVLGVMLYR